MNLQFALVLFTSISLFHASFVHAESTPPSQPLSLRAAVDLALKNNPLLAESNEKVNQAQTEKPFARSALFPNLTGVAYDERLKDATLNSLGRFRGHPYDQYEAQLKLSQTIFQIGTISAIHAADKDIHITKLNADISRRDLISNVIQAYYQIVLAARNVETLVAQEKIAKETVNVSTHRQKTGRGQLLDSLQAKTQLALLHGQLSTAQNSLQVAAANLTNLLGEPNKNQQYKLPDSMEPPPLPEVDKNFITKDVHIPEIDIADVSIQRISDQRDVLWGQNLPTLGVLGAYNFTSYHGDDLFEERANSWMLGLQLTVPIFSGFSTRAQDQALLSQETQLKFNKTYTENLVSEQQVTNRKNLETAHDSIQTGIEGLELATASSKEARRNYNLGTIDFLQYLTVQQTQVVAEQSLNVYKYNYLVALTAYFASYGQDLSQLVSRLDKSVH